ncbi:MAG: hypothetical protein NC311_09975 [Muribaculaceae bacterium]|nr:hypothetical protein [Muribaculaceae bacterium]
MTKDIEKILETAQRYKACDVAHKITDMPSAIATLLSPQGREFALHTCYPDLATFRENAEAVAKVRGVFLDRGKCLVSNIDCIAVGDTELTLSLSGTDRLYHVMAMHGAHVTVDARRYATVTVTKAGGSVTITGDGTAAISIEKR